MGKQPEGKLSTAIMQMLRKRKGFCYKVWGNEMTPAGIPDICGSYKGRSIWFESKLPGNGPTAIQLYRIEQIRRSGALVCIPYSLQEARQMLDHIDARTCSHARLICEYRRIITTEEIKNAKPK